MRRDRQAHPICLQLETTNHRFKRPVHGRSRISREVALIAGTLGTNTIYRS